MADKHTPLPWKVWEQERWPFDISIIDANGGEVLRQDRYTYSTEDKSLGDVHLRTQNDPQLQMFAYIVQCCNAHPKLVEALKVAQHALTVTHNVLATDRPDLAAFATDCAWTTDFTDELSVIEAALRAAGEEL